MYLNLLNLLLFSFFFSFVEKEKGKGWLQTRAVDVEKYRGRSKSVKAVRAYVCFLEREVYAFLSTFDKRGERVRGECCGPAFFVYGEAAEAGGQTAADRPAAERRAGGCGQEQHKKEEKWCFSFLGGRFLLSLPWKRRDVDAAALECMGGRGFMGIDRPRESLCVGGFAQGCAAQGGRSLQRVDTLAAAGRQVPAYPAYTPQIPMRRRRARGMEMSLFSLTLYIQYIIKFGGCQKWKLEEIGQYGKFWKARDCGKWKCGKACVGGNGREVRWLPPNIFFLTFL